MTAAPPLPSSSSRRISPPHTPTAITTPLPSPWWTVGGGLATTATGLSAAKPPSWWRSDDGTATTATPCGVGLWRRNPEGCLAVLSRLTPPLWRRPSRLWPQQPPQPHHDGVGLVVVIPQFAI
nr:hypothetical protein [Tanacetum cinerariifolium]